MALTDKGFDPIESQGDGRPVSGRGVYVHDASGNYLEALNQPQADGFLRMGFRLASPEEAKKYNERVKENKEESTEVNTTLEARRANPTEREVELREAAFQRSVDANAPQAQEQPKTVDDVQFDKEVAALNGDTSTKENKAETKSDTTQTTQSSLKNTSSKK